MSNVVEGYDVFKYDFESELKFAQQVVRIQTLNSGDTTKLKTDIGTFSPYNQEYIMMLESLIETNEATMGLEELVELLSKRLNFYMALSCRLEAELRAFKRLVIRKFRLGESKRPHFKIIERNAEKRDA